MAELNPVFLDGLTYPAKELRKILGDIYTEGILTSGALAITQSGTPAMSVSVAAGRAVVTNDEGNFGKYVIENYAPVTKTIAASDPSNPRIDIIIGQLRDATDISGADNDWQLQVLTGTPAASPSAPALPSNALNIATVAVAAGVTTIVNANITDSRTVATLGTIATGVEVTTGTNNTKIVTPKAIGDALVNTRLKSKVITFTRDMGSASGDVSYTGVGFPVTSVKVLAEITGTHSMCMGFADSSKAGSCIYTTAAATMNSVSDQFIRIYTSAGVGQYATIKTYDASDGFTLTWVREGTPTGTIALSFLCLG